MTSDHCWKHHTIVIAINCDKILYIKIGWPTISLNDISQTCLSFLIDKNQTDEVIKCLIIKKKQVHISFVESQLV